MTLTIVDGVTSSTVITATLVSLIRPMSAKDKWLTYAVIIGGSLLGTRLIAISLTETSDGIAKSIPMAVE